MYDITGYHEAHQLADVFAVIRTDPQARLIAGGTDVLVKNRAEAATYAEVALIGIRDIPELQGIRLEADGTISIGALCSFDEIEHNPIIQQHMGLLAQAVSLVGGPQTRHMGTIGGNICNAGPGADSSPSLLAYNAVLEIQSPAGTRQLPISEFFTGPSQTVLEPGDVVVRIKISQADYQGYVGYYTKFARRNALDIANQSCAALIKVNDQQEIQDLRIAFGASAPTPVRAPHAEAYAQGKTISPEVLQAIGEACLKDTKTHSGRNSKAFRDHLVTVLPGRNIMTALKGDE